MRLCAESLTGMLWVLGGDLMRVQCDHRGCELELDLQDASVHYVTLWLRCTMSHGERADAQARWFEKRERERVGAWKVLTSLLCKAAWLLLLPERAETLRNWSARAMCGMRVCHLCSV